MTTEEKVREIAENQPFAFGNDNYRLMIEWGAEKMAEWKDQQFKEYLEKKKLSCVMNAKQVFGYDMGGAYDWELKAHFCDEILQELFPNDKVQN